MPAYAAPKLANTAKPQDNAVAEALQHGARAGIRTGDILARRDLGPSRSVRIYGARFTDPTQAFWKNEDAYPVGVEVVITKAGPIGSTCLVDGLVLPADMIGNRSQRVGLDLNESLPILFSSAVIEAKLFIVTPTRPLSGR